MFNETSNKVESRKTTPLPFARATTKKLKNVTYAQLFEQHDHQKDSKELKVQFVLDCDLKDSMQSGSGLNIRKPTVSKNSVPAVKRPVYYPNYQNSFNQRFPTKNTYGLLPNRRPSVVYPTKKPQPKPPIKGVLPTPSTQKPKVVYVDPPGIAVISNALENVYNYFEDALTSKEKVRRAKNRQNNKRRGAGKLGRKKKKKPGKKGSAKKNRVTKPTSAPVSRSTKPVGVNNKLTTQIHVVSQYVGKDPTTTTPQPDEEDSYEDDEYVDSGDYDANAAAYDDEDGKHY